MRAAARVGIPGTVALVLTALFAWGSVTPANAARMDATAQKFAGIIKPSGGGDFEKAVQKTIQVITFLEKSYRGNGPPPETLFATTYREFLPQVGGYRAMETSSAMVAAWKRARLLGLFDEDGSFQRKITKGRDLGENCAFEHSVPASKAPKLAGEIMNLRIVPPSERRTSDELNAREAALLTRLNRIVESEGAVRKVASTEKREETRDAKEAWKERVNGAGEAFQGTPNIILEGGITATPGAKTKNRWRVTMKTTNLSRHPTEVKIEVFIVGVTAEKREHYLMAKHEKTLQLRAGAYVEGEYFTNAENSYRKKVQQIDGKGSGGKGKKKKGPDIRLRGWAARVTHGGQLVATAASMSDLLGYVDGGGGRGIEDLP